MQIKGKRKESKGKVNGLKASNKEESKTKVKSVSRISTDTE
jgi:hypothetical protein